jgi:hypothetical protein
MNEIYHPTNLSIDLNYATKRLYRRESTNSLYYHNNHNYVLCSVQLLQKAYISKYVTIKKLNKVAASVLYDYVISLYGDDTSEITLLDVNDFATLYIAIHGKGYDSLFFSDDTIAYTYALLLGLPQSRIQF